MKVGNSSSLFLLATSLLLVGQSEAFSTSRKIVELRQQQFANTLGQSSLQRTATQRSSSPLVVVLLAHPGGAPSSSTAAAAPPTGFIDTELRGAAMRLHTRAQAPKEGQAEATKAEKAPEKYVPTQADYLQFLVDSQYVYQAFEDIVNSQDALAVYRNTGLERTTGLETDIDYMMEEFQLERPAVGEKGKAYADLMKNIVSKGDDFVPEFMCHYYNFYFAHTAGGRMIGKQMSALLLNKKTLEFYKWDGDLNEIKGRVKESIEDMAAQWSQEEKDQCVAATADAFKYGGGINAYLSGGRSGH